MPLPELRPEAVETTAPPCPPPAVEVETGSPDSRNAGEALDAEPGPKRRIDKARPRRYVPVFLTILAIFGVAAFDVFLIYPWKPTEKQFAKALVQKSLDRCRPLWNRLKFIAPLSSSTLPNSQEDSVSGREQVGARGALDSFSSRDAPDPARTPTLPERNPGQPEVSSDGENPTAKGTSPRRAAGPPEAQDSAKSRGRSSFGKTPADTESVQAAYDAGEELFDRGEAYLYGRGVYPNCDQALGYLRKAADMGNLHARNQLGALYATGHCVPVDRIRAYNWFDPDLNISRGDKSWGRRMRAILWREMTDTERAQVKHGEVLSERR